MSEQKLKPCPFCGSEGIENHKEAFEEYICECSNKDCPASYMIGNSYDTREEAIEAWNRRFPLIECKVFDAAEKLKNLIMEVFDMRESITDKCIVILDDIKAIIEREKTKNDEKYTERID